MPSAGYEPKDRRFLISRDHSPPYISSFGWNVLRSLLFSVTLNLCCSLRLRDQSFTPCSATGLYDSPEYVAQYLDTCPRYRFRLLRGRLAGLQKLIKCSLCRVRSAVSGNQRGKEAELTENIASFCVKMNPQGFTECIIFPFTRTSFLVIVLNTKFYLPASFSSSCNISGSSNIS